MTDYKPLQLLTNVLPHASRAWAGNHYRVGRLRLDPLWASHSLCQIFCRSDPLGEDLDVIAHTRLAPLMQKLLQPVYPGWDLQLCLPLQRVGEFAAGDVRLPLLQRRLQWLHLRLTEGQGALLRVWLDTQLDAGRLVAEP